MLFGYGVLLLAQLGLLVYCTLDVLRTPAARVRGLSKPLWLVVVVLLPLVGGPAWLYAGRPLGGAPRPTLPPTRPDDDEDFLRELRRRADEQRRRAAEDEPPA